MEAPEEFLTRKSFNKLPVMAFMTWFLMFVIDSFFFRKLDNLADRHFYFLLTGSIIGSAFALIRVLALSRKDKWDYGLIVLNAFLILFSAAGFQGATKELAQLGYADSLDTMAPQKKGAQTLKEGRSNVQFAALNDFSFFANQTSYFPDFKVIAEKERLNLTNESLRQIINDGNDLSQVKDLQDQNAQLNLTNDSLEQIINKGSDCVSEVRGLQAQIAMLNRKNNRLQTKYDSLLSAPRPNDGYEARYQALARNIKETNRKLIRLQELRSNRCVVEWEKRYDPNLKEACKGAVNPDEYFRVLNLLTPIPD